MANDQEEVDRFKRALAKLPLEEIRRRLDGSLIVRPWKRDLAEAEAARRDEESRAIEEQSKRDVANARSRRRDISRRVWMLVVLISAAAVAVIWTVIRP